MTNGYGTGEELDQAASWFAVYNGLTVTAPVGRDIASLTSLHELAAANDIPSQFVSSLHDTVPGLAPAAWALLAAGGDTILLNRADVVLP